MARRPVASTNRQAASTLGPIDPAGKCMARSSAGRRQPDGPGATVSRTRIRRGHVGENHERVGVDVMGQQGRPEVLVDHRLDAAEHAVRRHG